MSASKPELMKCPGCKQIVSTSQYGEHMLSNHKVGLAVNEIPELPGGIGKSQGLLADWQMMWKHYPKAMMYWAFFWLVIGVLLGGRII